MSIETSAALFEQVDALTENGQLRRLSGAFARFIASVGASSPQLMVACVLLSELEGRGHSCLMLDELAGDPSGQLGWTSDEWRALRDAAGAWPRNAAAWRALLAGCDQVWPVGDLDFQQPLVLEGERLYLRRYWRDETLVAEAVRGRALGGLIAMDAETSTSDIRHWLDILFPHAPRGGATDWQKIACAVAMRGKLGIITGGPGTGKTYTVARLLALLFATAGARQSGLRVALAAPTGKAAARLKQSIDSALDDLAEKVGAALPLRELAARMGAARTLHSLLGARPGTRAFQHNAGNLLEVDVLIVDEASMIHLEMMSALLAALPPDATLILLGDKDQLASVEAGAVLGDLCHNAEAGAYESETLSYVQASTGQQIPDSYAGDGGPIAQQTVMLRESRRFGGPIGALALAVNAGNTASALQVLRDGTDGKVAWIDPAQSSDLLQLALAGRAGAPGGYQAYLKMVKSGAPEGEEIVHLAWVKSVLTSFETFRILCAVREGEWGVTGLNDVIEQRLQSAGLLRRSGEWYVGRPVMVTRNDYGTGVFNGDIGLTLPDPARPGALRVYFSEGDNVRSVLATRLRNVETAFAMTVHKSQGSEFQHTVLVLPKDSGGMLARELIYTGITRARDYFTLLTPNSQVLLDAIAQRTQRASGLRTLLGN
ncbi:exodeoxyribonuclease V subunit alpha [Duganella sp. BJB488]|uniref:exodeoxyribonuclease V subunit alpha n=1 Tax=unclassified Duganella TaxID=2636909 RepID=UPI000E355F91|nr:MULTISPECIES: exodeoxyribonuclease V subunit alpha [unclassified Duganella]RFP08781.1 exodeoxyribonuclease V subunit alpha [Duganella sp. BJB489]RFP18197.1 exodeoxyribonuclease V subunit alpha [Duganella sp. BJB488]RFP37958.1 exodeoxyribonuclease V subunit alpha [Duganella sp. BJB480]